MFMVQNVWYVTKYDVFPMYAVCSRCSGVFALAWLNVFTHQSLDGRLKLAVLGGVDQRIDTAAEEHQDDAEVVEPA